MYAFSESIPGWGNGEGFFIRIYPFGAFIDQHDWDIFFDRVFTVTVLANEPSLLIKVQHTVFFLYTVRTA